MLMNGGRSGRSRTRMVKAFPDTRGRGRNCTEMCSTDVSRFSWLANPSWTRRFRLAGRIIQAAESARPTKTAKPDAAIHATIRRFRDIGFRAERETARWLPRKEQELGANRFCCRGIDQAGYRDLRAACLLKPTGRSSLREPALQRAFEADRKASERITIARWKQRGVWTRAQEVVASVFQEQA